MKDRILFILLVKMGKYIGFRLYRRSLCTMVPPVIDNADNTAPIIYPATAVDCADRADQICVKLAHPVNRAIDLSQYTAEKNYGKVRSHSFGAYFSFKLCMIPGEYFP